jgi:pimeloyl-ACP methyl ester carboxylesterase
MIPPINSFPTFLSRAPLMLLGTTALLLANLSVVWAFCPVVICPGFGNDSIDYDTPLEQPAEVGLKSVLARRGFEYDQIYTVPVKRSDWIKVAGGLLDIPDFYLGNAKPTGRGYGWYLERFKETVDLAYEQQEGDNKEKVLVIGHSAGGWLARAAMSDGKWSVSSQNDDETTDASNSVVRTSDRVRCLVTMGAIHRVPENESTCVTRGALRYTDENYPGAFLKDEGIKYVSIGGAAIVGDDSTDAETISSSQQPHDLKGSEADDYYKVRGEGNSNRVAFTSYKAVAGNGNLIGDGVVPLEWTQLDGSKQIELLDVVHSINEAGTTIPTDRWYGSENIIDQWLPTVMEEANLKSNNNNPSPLDGLQQWASNFIKN